MYLCNPHMQEQTGQVHAVVDVLLNFQQFKTAVPDSPLFHLPFGMLILYKRNDVPTSTFEGLADPPPSIE